MKNKRKNWNPLKKIEEGPLHSAAASLGLSVLALLRSADYCASEMVAQVNLATASLGLSVLEATNRKPDALVHVVVQVRTDDIVVVQVHVVRFVATVL